MAELTPNQKALVGYMTRGEQHAVHGFSLILKNPHPEAFFDELLGKGLLDPVNNPKPRPVAGQEGFFQMPYWTALDYLEHVGSIAREADDIQLGDRVMDTVRSIASYRENGRPVDNYHTFTGLAEIIGKVPPSCVTSKDVDLVEIFLATRWSNSAVVPKLDHVMKNFLSSPSAGDHVKAVRLLEHCTKLKPDSKSGSSSRTSTTVADAYWLEQLLKHHVERLGEVGKAPALNCLLARLRQLFEDEYISTHTWLWRAAIEEHEQNHDWDHVTNAFVDSARDALDAWISVEPSSARTYVDGMFRDESQIVRRIAINATRCRWAVLDEAFINALAPRLFDVGHLHELYLLLRECFPKINQDGKRKIVEIILRLSEACGEASEDRERARYQQRNWLDAIRGLGDKRVDDAYRSLTESLGPLREHPDLLSYHWTQVGSGPSPFSEEELVAFSDDRSLITRIDAFEPPRDERRSSRKSLIDALSQAVQMQPLRFTWTLAPNVRMSRRIQYGLIHGFSKYIDKIKESQDANCTRQVLDALLPYLVSLVKDETFWQEPVPESRDFEPDKNWIPAAVVEVAKKLVSNDEVNLVPSDYDHLLATILAVKKHSVGVEPSDDPMTEAINNTRGVSVEALLQFVLRRCRESDKVGGRHDGEWNSLRANIDDELSRCVCGERLETSTLFACYLAQLLYVDHDWVRGNIERLFPFSHIKNFVCAIAGLSFANVSPRVYSVLKDADVPRFALRQAEVEGSSRERLLERVALAYVWGDELLTGSLLSELFSDTRLDDLIELSATVARWSREDLKEVQVIRAKRLAAAITAFGMIEPDSRSRLLAAAGRFIGYATKPTDGDMKWLVQVAAFAHGSHGDDYFLEALDCMASEDPHKAHLILEAFLRDYELGYDYRGRMQSIVRKLDAAGYHPSALSIVNKVVEAGGGAKWVELYKDLTSNHPQAAGDNGD